MKVCSHFHRNNPNNIYKTSENLRINQDYKCLLLTKEEQKERTIERNWMKNESMFSFFTKNKPNNICKTDATHLLQNGITQKFIIDPRMVWNFNMLLDSHYVTHFSSGCYHKCSERFTFKRNCWVLL